MRPGTAVTRVGAGVKWVPMVAMHSEIETLLENYPGLKPIAADIQRGCNLLIDCYRGGGKVLVCGNGGSAADCEHLVGELMKGYLTARPLPASQRAALMAAAPADGAYLADHL